MILQGKFVKSCKIPKLEETIFEQKSELEKELNDVKVALEQSNEQVKDVQAKFKTSITEKLVVLSLPL